MSTIDKRAIVEEYIECKQTIKDIEARAAELQDIIKGFSEVDDKYDLEQATVTYQPGRATYTYSPALTERMNQVKDDQKSEVQNGIAEEVVGAPYLVVKFKKHG